MAQRHQDRHRFSRRVARKLPFHRLRHRRVVCGSPLHFCCETALALCTEGACGNQRKSKGARAGEKSQREGASSSDTASFRHYPFTCSSAAPRPSPHPHEHGFSCRWATTPATCVAGRTQSEKSRGETGWRKGGEGYDTVLQHPPSTHTPTHARAHTCACVLVQGDRGRGGELELVKASTEHRLACANAQR